MFEYIRGIYQGQSAGSAVLECGGVGWSLVLSPSNIAELEQNIGREVLVYTHHLQREDAQEIYGFITREERGLFRKLMLVSGVGPKQAMRILAGMAPAVLVQALRSENLALLASIPGLGNKTAQKLIFELKGKMDEFAHLASGAEAAGDAPPLDSSRAADDCCAALQALGYAPIEARAALRQALTESAPGEKVEDLVKRALRYAK